MLPAEAIDELTPSTSSGAQTPGVLTNERVETRLPLAEGIRTPPALELQTPSKRETQATLR